MNEEELIDALALRGLPDRGAAGRAMRAALSAFTECLTQAEAEAFARSFSGDLASRARRGPDSRDETWDAEELFEVVRRRENVSPGAAREHTQIVLAAIAERLDPEVRAWLLKSLPAGVAALLRPRDVGASPPHTHPGHAPPLTTLASGKPGSHHPLSESAPGRAQSHSVVSEENPHGDTKLSSARGLTQERLADTIATGRPGPERPISEARDEEDAP